MFWVLDILKKNKLVISNYSFLTIVQFINSGFSLLIYPLIIARVGVESYGVFVYASTIGVYCSVFVNLGFDILGLNKITGVSEDKKKTVLYYR